MISREKFIQLYQESPTPQQKEDLEKIYQAVIKTGVQINEYSATAYIDAYRFGQENGRKESISRETTSWTNPASQDCFPW